MRQRTLSCGRKFIDGEEAEHKANPEDQNAVQEGAKHKVEASVDDKQVNQTTQSISELKLHDELVGETGNADEVEGDQCHVTLSALQPCRGMAPLRKRERERASTSGCPRSVQPTLLFLTRPDPPVLELNCMENLELGEEASFDLSTQTISNASLAAENSSGANSNNQGLGEETPFDIHAYLNKELEDYQEEHPRIQGSTKKGYADMQFTGEAVLVPEETYQRLEKK